MATSSVVFSLPPPPPGWVDGTIESIGFLSAPIQRLIEPAGRGFELHLKNLSKKTQNNDNDDEDDEETQQEQDGDDGDDDVEAFKAFAHKHRDLAKKAVVDYYELLGLSDVRWRATPDQIKQAYRKMILLYHPDKMKANDHPEVNDEIFKSIQKAYDTLSDLKKRRAYDSSEEFDDSIPSEKAAERREFFSLFDPVFERNARYEEVMKFYEFWWNFNSWRDFSFDDEYDVDDAESRDERRWMERQNEKHHSVSRNEERKRILKLADLAHKKDPRITKHEEGLKEAKRKKHEEKTRRQREEAERMRRQENLKREQEEKRKAEEVCHRQRVYHQVWHLVESDPKILRKQREKQKETEFLYSQRDRLREICGAFQNPPSNNELDKVCERLSAVRLEEVNKRMEGENSNEAKLGLFKEIAELLAKEDEEKLKQEQEKERIRIEEQNRKNAEKDRPWSEDELSQLAKAVAKYPGGTQSRWEAVARLVPTRTAREIASKIKDFKTIQHYNQKAALVQVKDPFEKLKEKVGDKTIESPLSQRWEDDPKPNNNATQPSKVETSAAKPVVGTLPPEAVDWSIAEQKLLEQGLQQFPNTAETRWDSIAALVKTKTKKECIARFKYLVSVYKGKK